MKRLEKTTLVVKSILDALDCPRSLTVWLLYESGEHSQLVDLEIREQDYGSSREFRDAYQATKLLSKATFLSLNTDKKEVALDKFRRSESQCAETNQRLSNPLYFVSEGVEPLVFRMVRKISIILGRFDADAWIDSCDFGPGSTTLTTGLDTSHARKYQSETGTTPRLINLLSSLGAWKHVSENWSPRLTIEGASKVITVPKNAKEDRTIAVEPGINLWFQKGIGSMLKSRLLRAGLDLDEHGTSRKRNQILCESASKNGALATIDFSAASDTIAKATVFELLPPDWFHAMWLTRSSHGVLNGEMFVYEKFSSMGNGFTFELESLIFYTAAIVCCEALDLDCSEVSVFGDDVIIPVGAVRLYLQLTKCLGFTVNLKKSCVSGYFRESCGDHWYNGLNCKPYYLREVMHNDNEIYKAANSVRRLAHRRNSYGCDRRLLGAWRLLRKSIPNGNLICEGYGDGGFISNFDEASPSLVRAPRGFEGFYCMSLVFRASRSVCDHHGLLLSKVRRGSSEDSVGNAVSLRRRGKWTRKRLLIPRWFDMGPWI